MITRFESGIGCATEFVCKNNVVKGCNPWYTAFVAALYHVRRDIKIIAEDGRINGEAFLVHNTVV